jgi:sulfoxide reductase heme-binding subunit YedZ
MLQSQRIKRHLLLLLAMGLLLVASVLQLPYDTPWERISVGSAWLCVLLMCAALLIGPLRRMRGELSPNNIHLRRDLGIWAALLSFLHFYAGNVIAMNPVYIEAFVRGPAVLTMQALRNQLFALGSIVGLIVAIIFIVLLAISSDRALRWIKPERWKKIQRSAHVALWLTVLHGIAFQLLEARFIPLALLVGATLVVFVLQWRGRRGLE